MLLIADIVLFSHMCVVIFVTFGFFLIPIGYKFGWIWIANKKLKLIHSGLMAFITLESLFGITCPLTFVENYFRGIYQYQSFIGYWIERLIYWDFSPQIFIVLYCTLLGWTLFMWKLFPPRNPWEGLIRHINFAVWRSWLMIKFIPLIFIALLLTWLVMRYFPNIRFHAQRLLKNPFVKAIIIRVIWRLILRR